MCWDFRNLKFSSKQQNNPFDAHVILDRSRKSNTKIMQQWRKLLATLLKHLQQPDDSGQALVFCDVATYNR